MSSLIMVFFGMMGIGGDAFLAASNSIVQRNEKDANPGTFIWRECSP